MSYMNPMNAVSPANTMNPMDHFCPDCPTQTVYDPPVTLYEDYYHPQLVNVVQAVEVVKQHHCCPVYHKSCVYTEKDVMVRVSSKRAKTSSKKPASRTRTRSKKR
ncbi:hypothetical protein [Paenibacillus sacheonensis]|uniref:hypothetical protein n=1 Tax=Paenibacillus sacheonensis TaxID=742054 RepID=UPI0019593943|nr:hypothetical protein [Paenibacillus sacheonensis]MBM7567281.1 hypothetical protein [Paenibacillus sacheonensis]